MKPFLLGLCVFLSSHSWAESVYQKLSLKDGDVISEINGQPVADPGEVLQQLNAPGGVGRVQVLREGKPVELTRDCGPVPPGGSFDKDCNLVLATPPRLLQ